MERVVIAMAFVELYNYVSERDNRSDDTLIAEAEAYYKEQYNRYGDERYAKILERGFGVMSFETYLNKQREYLCTDAPKEITKEAYDDAFNVLPPILLKRNGNIRSFCMREFYSGTITSQYAHDTVTDKYYTALVDVADKSTWLFNRIAA